MLLLGKGGFKAYYGETKNAFTHMCMYRDAKKSNVVVDVDVDVDIHADVTFGATDIAMLSSQMGHNSGMYI